MTSRAPAGAKNWLSTPSCHSPAAPLAPWATCTVSFMTAGQWCDPTHRVSSQIEVLDADLDSDPALPPAPDIHDNTPHYCHPTWQWQLHIIDIFSSAQNKIKFLVNYVLFLFYIELEHFPSWTTWCKLIYSYIEELFLCCCHWFIHVYGLHNLINNPLSLVSAPLGTVLGCWGAASSTLGSFPDC